MVYITANGSIGQEVQFKSNPKEFLRRKIFCQNGIVAAGVLIAIAIRVNHSNPFANGAIPAAKRSPAQHWGHMARDVTFIRTMTEPLAGRSKASSQAGKGALKRADLTKFMDRVDFGGADGHIAEAGGEMDVEQLRVTQCSTTRSGVTAYFCVAEVATNQDAALGHKGKGWNSGVRSFREYLECCRERGLDGGAVKRSVYRLGIRCKDSLAGMSHAWSLVANPDGTYFWLQSYISQYSLSTWLKKPDPLQKSELAGHLMHAELLRKLDGIDRLMNINGWTEEANTDYYDLFNVDKNHEKAKGGFRRPRKEWEPSHRLEHFYWDEACEYPLSDTAQPAAEENEHRKSDQCDALRMKSSLAGLLGVGGAATLGTLLDKTEHNASPQKPENYS